MGKQGLSPILVFYSDGISHYSRFANSGHQVPFPQWQSNQTNIDRTNSVIKQIAHDFRKNSNVVSAIGALNESVI
jgi:hypothetical protein